MPSIQSVHQPGALNTISIRGWGRKEKRYSIDDINAYAKEKGIAFKEAYYTLLEKAFCKEEEK